MASPHKRRGKKVNGSYGKINPAEVIEESPKVAPANPEVAPKPKKKRKSFFDKE